MKFKNFLQESENNDIKNLIFDIIDEMGEEEIKDLGYTIYYEFFGDDSDIEEFDDFCIDDVKKMVTDLGPDYYDEILDLIQPEDFDIDNISLDDEFYKKFYNDFGDIADLDEDSLVEALTITGRLKRAMTLKRNANKIKKAKARKEKRSFLSKEDLNKRARRIAVKILTAKWSKGRTDKVTKERIENRLAASKDLIARLAAKQRKMVIKNHKNKIAARRAALKGINKEDNQ